MSSKKWQTAQLTFRETALFLSENLYSILWAIALSALIFWSANTAQHGLFNAAMTFGLYSEDIPWIDKVNTMAQIEYVIRKNDELRSESRWPF